MAERDDAARRKTLESIRAQIELFEKIPVDRAFTEAERRQYERLTSIERHLAASVAEQMVDLTAKPDLRERRGQRSGAVNALVCRLCGETTPLEREHMKRRPSGLMLCCVNCHGEFAIRRTDADRLSPRYAHIRRRGA